MSDKTFFNMLFFYFCFIGEKTPEIFIQLAVLILCLAISVIGNVFLICNRRVCVQNKGKCFQLKRFKMLKLSLCISKRQTTSVFHVQTRITSSTVKSQELNHSSHGCDSALRSGSGFLCTNLFSLYTVLLSDTYLFMT